MAGAARPGPTCLLLGATGVGKSLLGKRLRNIRASWGSRGAGPGWGCVARFCPVLNAPAQLCSRDGAKELGEPPATLPTVGTNLTDLTLHRRVTLRELGGCMGPIWPSYYGECSAVLVSARPAALRGCGMEPPPPPPPPAPLSSLSAVRDRCRQPDPGLLVLRPAAVPSLRRAARRCARADPLQQDVSRASGCCGSCVVSSSLRGR